MLLLVGDDVAEGVGRRRVGRGELGHLHVHVPEHYRFVRHRGRGDGAPPEQPRRRAEHEAAEPAQMVGSASAPAPPRQFGPEQRAMRPLVREEPVQSEWCFQALLRVLRALAESPLADCGPWIELRQSSHEGRLPHPEPKL